MTWYSQPFVAFDTETTGLSYGEDWILSACVATLIPHPIQWQVNIQSWLLNHDIDVPAAAYNVHGLHRGFLGEHGRDPIECMNEMNHLLAQTSREGVPIVGMNLTYDFSMAHRNSRRLGVKSITELLNGDPSPVIDCYVIDKQFDKYRSGSRKLGALCQHYKVRHDGEHDSTADALAAARVCYRQALTYPQVGTARAADLHASQMVWRASWALEFQAHKRKTDPAAVIDPCWPVCYGHGDLTIEADGVRDHTGVEQLG